MRNVNKTINSMKKSLQALMTGAAALLIAACAKETVINTEPADEQSKPISFTTFADKATKGTVPSDTTGTLEYYHKTMRVWGTKIAADKSTQLVFDSVEVTNTSGTWSYSPTRYWDKQADYQFIAMAPDSIKNFYYVMDKADSLVKSGNINMFKTTANYTLNGQNLNKDTTSVGEILNGFTGPGNDIDIMISKAVLADGENKPLVNFIMSHTLSKFNIKVKATTGSTPANVTMDSIIVTGLVDNGSFADSLWTAGSSNTNSDYVLRYDYQQDAAKLKFDTIESTPKYYVESLVMPQKAGSSPTKYFPGHIKMVYKVETGGSFTETFTYNADIKDIFKNDTLGFNGGYNYTICFDINLSGEDSQIKFDAGVYKWSQANDSTVVVK